MCFPVHIIVLDIMESQRHIMQSHISEFHFVGTFNSFDLEWVVSNSDSISMYKCLEIHSFLPISMYACK